MPVLQSNGTSGSAFGKLVIPLVQAKLLVFLLIVVSVTPISYFFYMDPREKMGKLVCFLTIKQKDNLLESIKANQSTLNLFQSG